MKRQAKTDVATWLRFMVAIEVLMRGVQHPSGQILLSRFYLEAIGLTEEVLQDLKAFLTSKEWDIKTEEKQ